MGLEEKKVRTTTVLTQDLWDALDALDAVPEAQNILSGTKGLNRLLMRLLRL